MCFMAATTDLPEPKNHNNATMSFLKQQQPFQYQNNAPGPLQYQNNAPGPFQNPNSAQQPLLYQSKAQHKKGRSKLYRAIKRISSMFSSNKMPPHLSNCACNYHTRKREEFKQKTIAEAKQRENDFFNNSEPLHSHDVHGCCTCNHNEVFSNNNMESCGANDNVCCCESEGGSVNCGANWEQMICKCKCNNQMHMPEPSAPPLPSPSRVQYDTSGVDEKSEEFIQKFYEDLTLQRQRSFEDCHAMLSRSA